MIIDEEEGKSLDDFTPVSKAIRSRHIPDWSVMIITEEKYRDKVEEKAKKILFS